MSLGTIKRLPDTQKSPRSNLRITEIIAQLDERLNHLRESILPKQPYLLSIPSDVPYRHSSRFVNTWYEGTPFDRKEEQLQYMSFLPHLGEHESLLKVEGGWADEQGNPIEEELSPKTVPASGNNTPAELGHRKKISLKDYTTKGKSPPDSISHPRPTGANSDNTKQETIESSTGKKPQEVLSSKQMDNVLETDQKIPRLDGQSSPLHGPIDKNTTSPNPAKRRKLSPPFEDQKSIPNPPKSESQSSIMKMPRLLSPTLPSPEKESGLPQILSPVLPPSLARAISTPPGPISTGSPANGPHQRTDPVRAILARAEIDYDHSNDRNGLASGGSQVRSDSQHSARCSAPGTPNAAKVGLGAKVLSKTGIKAGTPLHNGARASPGPRQRHTIILKYGKKNRKRVEALLKFAPRPRKDMVKQEAIDSPNTPVVQPKKEAIKSEPSDSHGTAQGKPKGIVVNNDKVERKRRAENSPGPSLKKMKASNLATESDKRPSTPVPSAGKPSLTPHPRSTFSTPKKDLKSTAMRRVESSEGVDAPTPSGDKGRVSTPSTVPKPSPQPAPTSTTREEERQQWTAMNNKFFTLGRTLKHEGTSMLPSSSDADAKSGQSAKAVLLLIEALLCFMINMSAQAHARPSADPGWRSIILYHIFIFRVSRRYPHLHGLVVQLGAVCRQLIHKYDMDRLARDPLPDDYCNSAPTPGSDGNTKTNEDGEKYKKRYVEFKDDLIHNARELQTAWLDGSRQLSPDLLKHEYPTTWSKRAKDASVRLQEKPSPSRIARDFYLPMDSNTTPFEAARFGVAFLEEWAEKEKVEWKTRIDL
ncbi:uncharacterized protein Z518_11356 [Rhinocladiella mackenziei CBS 650.93]|uniref:Uncharacterized protein n=1 Tax=Rhinocladiella mackenziei CBS 650.93 TaxID=1442369 RepID=A0A0D2I0W7_9EURO|nr:uncharacterized protein Z518_11356 [Rhinocladiella mackenziei CBS 650.93]KIW99368.1 hypothetical protein Z518_11356 [Rhinocladiella mackenziei CBS 650.93]